MYLTRIELNQDKLVPFATFINKEKGTSIKYKVERDERYLPYIELGRWLCGNLRIQSLRLTPERKLDYFLQKYNFVMTK